MHLLILLSIGFILAKSNDASKQESMEDAMELCNEECKCNEKSKSIVCNRMKDLWFLVIKGAKYADEFTGFNVKVSDRKLIKIDNRFALNSGEDNGLKYIKSLTLSTFKSLKSIDSSFFEDNFPELESLTVTESDNHLEELTVGRLPHLKFLQINGHKIQKINGCGEKTRFCFNDNKMYLLEVPTLNMKHIGLPQYISVVKIDLNDVSVELGDENLFKDKIMRRLDFTTPRVMTFPAHFSHIESVVEFNLEIPPMKEEQLLGLMRSVQETPLLAYRMNLKMKSRHDNNDVKFPVIMKPCPNCNFDEMSAIADIGGVCYDEQRYLDTYNCDISSEFQKNRNLTIRGIFVDIDNILRSLDGDSSFHVTVYTFIAKVPKKRHINFDLKVYYAVLQNEGELSQTVTIRKPYTMIRMEETFGAPLQYAKSLDGIFVHQYSLCIAKLALRSIRESSEGRFKNGIAWNMFLNLPAGAINTPSAEPLVNSKTLAIQGLLHRYMYMYASDMHKTKKLPSMPIYMQEELAEILIESAANIEEKRIDFGMRQSFNDMQNTNTFHIKTVIDHEDNKQIKFLKYEQTKVLKLASLTLRKREMYDVRLKKIRESLNELVKTSVDTGNELEAKAKTFITAAITRNAHEWASIGSDISYSLVSVITTGGFDYHAVEQKAVDGGCMMIKLNKIVSVLYKLQQLMEIMKRISVMYSEVKEIFKMRYEILKRNLKKLDKSTSPKVKTKYGGLYNRISKGLMNVEDIGEGVLALSYAKTAQLEYDDGNEKLATAELNIVKIENNLLLSDIEKWDSIQDKVEYLFDGNVTLKIPGTEEFKATIYNMITKSKSITQLRFAESRMMSELISADKDYWEYIEEYAALGNAIDDIRISGMQRHVINDYKRALEEYKSHYKKSEKYIFYVTFINKLRIIDAHNDFCKGYFYFHLRQCPIQNYVDIFIPIGEVKNRYDDLLFDNTIKKFQNFNPPPQSFENFEFIVRKEQNCKCVMEPYNNLKDITTDRNITDDEVRKFIELSKLTCFPQEKMSVSNKAVMSKLDRCSTNLIENFIDQRTISIEIPINYKEDFINYERVRIDEVRVFLEGVKTANGKVIVKIASPGIIQDRYQGDVFKFYGSQWARTYEYCGKDIKQQDSSKDYDPFELSVSCKNQNYKTLLSTSVHDDYKGVHLKPSLFSTWIVSVPAELNPGLDLQSVESIEINFSGSLIPGSTNYKSYDVEGNRPKNTDHDDDVDDTVIGITENNNKKCTIL